MVTKTAANPGWARFDAWAGIEPTIRIGNLVFTSGSTPTEPDGALVGLADLNAQTRQALANLETMLTTAGSSVADLVEMTVFLVEPSLKDGMGDWAPALLQFTGRTQVAVTVVGVSSLAFDGQLIEIKAVAAVLD